MDDAMFQDYMKNRYENQMNWYDGKASFNQKKYKHWTLTVIVLSALTPVFAALDVGSGGNNASGATGANDTGALMPILYHSLKYSLIIISAVVAIGTTILKTFRYQELWTTYRDTTERLRSEKYLFEAQLGAYSQKDIDLRSLFVVQVEAILAKEHSRWFSTNQNVPVTNAQTSQDKGGDKGNDGDKPQG